jgi:alkylglycerol monooxygenase
MPTHASGFSSVAKFAFAPSLTTDWESVHLYLCRTALRQSSLHSLASNFYYVPLALLFPPHLFYIHSQFNLLYQYFLHTEVIGKLGPLEWVLNTPSQHRLHHGRQPYAIDTNYGGRPRAHNSVPSLSHQSARPPHTHCCWCLCVIALLCCVLCVVCVCVYCVGSLSIWDRMFGTFQEEIDEFPPAYGITHALNTFDPFYANLHPWLGILQNMRSVSGLRNKFLCLYNGPGWIPGSHPEEEYEIPPCTRETVVKYNPSLPGLFQVYLLLQFTTSILMQSLVVANLRSDDPALFRLALLGMTVLFVTLYALAALCDRRWFAFPLEVVRLLGVSAFALHLVDQVGPGLHWSNTPTLAVLLYGALALLWLACYRTAICTPLRTDELGHDLPSAAEAHRRIEQRIAHKVVVNKRWIKAD